jgi:hypothetical protein
MKSKTVDEIKNYRGNQKLYRKSKTVEKIKNSRGNQKL